MMRGHFTYYGITGNGRRLQWYARQVERIWRRWLARRSRTGVFYWQRMRELLKRRPLPPPRIIHVYTKVSEARP